MTNSNPCNTPAMKESVNDDLTSFQDTKLFMKQVGSLIYLATQTRPDISYAVNKLSQRMANPRNCDKVAGKRILRYLNGTRSLGITYSDRDDLRVECYSDSDFAGDLESRKSRSGHV